MQQAHVKAPTLWNSIPCTAKRCMAVIGTNKLTMLNGIAGKLRQVVLVIVDGRRFYLDNEDGTGWMKVSDNMRSGYRELPIKQVVCFLE